jgi:hypothetical protein
LVFGFVFFNAVFGLLFFPVMHTASSPPTPPPPSNERKKHRKTPRGRWQSPSLPAEEDTPPFQWPGTILPPKVVGSSRHETMPTIIQWSKSYFSVNMCSSLSRNHA